jgi:hypothetical protein
VGRGELGSCHGESVGVLHFDVGWSWRENWYSQRMEV